VTPQPLRLQWGRDQLIAELRETRANHDGLKRAEAYQCIDNPLRARYETSSIIGNLDLQPDHE
jgi:hypothetical protein